MKPIKYKTQRIKPSNPSHINSKAKIINYLHSEDQNVLQSYSINDAGLTVDVSWTTRSPGDARLNNYQVNRKTAGKGSAVFSGVRGVPWGSVRLIQLFKVNGSECSWVLFGVYNLDESRVVLYELLCQVSC